MVAKLIELRIAADGEDIEQQIDRAIAALEAAGFELVQRSKPYANRNDSGKRVYLSFIDRKNDNC